MKSSNILSLNVDTFSQKLVNVEYGSFQNIWEKVSNKEAEFLYVIVDLTCALCGDKKLFTSVINAYLQLCDLSTRPMHVAVLPLSRGTTGVKWEDDDYLRHISFQDAQERCSKAFENSLGSESSTFGEMDKKVLTHVVGAANKSKSWGIVRISASPTPLHYPDVQYRLKRRNNDCFIFEVRVGYTKKDISDGMSESEIDEDTHLRVLRYWKRTMLDKKSLQIAKDNATFGNAIFKDYWVEERDRPVEHVWDDFDLGTVEAFEPERVKDDKANDQVEGDPALSSPSVKSGSTEIEERLRYDGERYSDGVYDYLKAQPVALFVSYDESFQAFNQNIKNKAVAEITLEALMGSKFTSRDFLAKLSINLQWENDRYTISITGEHFKKKTFAFMGMPKGAIIFNLEIEDGKEINYIDQIPKIRVDISNHSTSKSISRELSLNPNFFMGSFLKAAAPENVEHELFETCEQLEEELMQKSMLFMMNDTAVNMHNTGTVYKFKGINKYSTSRTGQPIIVENPFEIMVIGAMGSGKSSFCNTLLSALKSRITITTDQGNQNNHNTKKIISIPIGATVPGCNIILTDTPGMIPYNISSDKKDKYIMGEGDWLKFVGTEGIYDSLELFTKKPSGKGEVGHHIVKPDAIVVIVPPSAYTPASNPDSSNGTDTTEFENVLQRIFAKLNKGIISLQFFVSTVDRTIHIFKAIINMFININFICSL